ncbi:HDVAg-like protein [Cat Tien Odontotermes delta-like virus]|uniref:HDVAg-like protein n=1 Tax=Cat Tien Odontotermes delta-like virus TaxID=2952747 RepID=A0ABY5P2I3_9VIRU|nr:HDVAg-like protein [Cat Tien Odontotermes delta-like virus]
MEGAKRELPNDGGTSERFLLEWLEARRRVRSCLQRLREAQERVRLLERDHAWLGSFKGTLRKRDGESFDIPEGPRKTKRAQNSEGGDAVPSTSAAPPSQPQSAPDRKRKAAPLLEKAKREAEAKKKRLQPPPATPSPSTPRARSHVVGLSEASVSVLEKALEDAKRRMRRKRDSEGSELSVEQRSLSGDTGEGLE